MALEIFGASGETFDLMRFPMVFTFKLGNYGKLRPTSVRGFYHWSILEVLLKYYWSHVHPWVDGQWQSYFAYLQSVFFRWQSWRRKRCATRSWMRQGFSMIFSSRSSYSMLLVNVQLVCKGCVYFCVFTPTSGSLFCHAPCGSYGSCGSCNEHKKNTKHYVHSLQYLQYDMFWHVLTMVGICFLDNMQTKNQEI